MITFFAPVPGRKMSECLDYMAPFAAIYASIGMGVACALKFSVSRAGPTSFGVGATFGATMSLISYVAMKILYHLDYKGRIPLSLATGFFAAYRIFSSQLTIQGATILAISGLAAIVLAALSELLLLYSCCPR